VLWRIVAVGESAHWEGFYTLGSGWDIGFSRYPHRPDLLAGVGDDWSVRRLQYFTKGFYAVNEFNGDVVLTDLRMGQAGFYAFAFRVGERREARTASIAASRFAYPDPPLPAALGALGECMLGRSTELIACGPNARGGSSPLRPKAYRRGG